MLLRLLCLPLTLAAVLSGCASGGTDGSGTGDSGGTGTTSAVTGGDAEEPPVREKIEFTTENLDEYSIPEWYRDAKFGIFIHYGVYSVPAFGDEWYGHWMYMPGSAYGGSDIYTHHKNTYGGAAKFGYKDFIPEFNENLKKGADAGMFEDWAQLFEDAGAGFVIPVGIHHDSFALYDSDIQTTYNSVSQTGIDYIGELQKAVKAHGMKFGISNHFAENDWFFDDAAGRGTDVADKAYSELYGTGGDKTKEHVEKWFSISMEIIEKYRPDMVYYDFDLVNGAFDRYPDANRYLMLANYYNMAQEWEGNEGVVVANKNGAFAPTEALHDSERAALSAIDPTPWQTDTSVGKKSWGYTTDEVYRDGKEFIGALIDIVSKNGNLLLNIGPRADGSIPDEAREALLTVGNWLGTYGDAIYGTRPWIVYGEGPTNNSGDSYTFTERDIRFTRSRDREKLYVSVLAAPRGGTVSVTTLKKGAWDASKIASVCLIDGDARRELEWKQTDKALEITLPKEKPTGAFSMEITFRDGGTIPSLAVGADSSFEISNPEDADGIAFGSATEDGSDSVYNKKDGAYAAYRIGFGGSESSFFASVSGSSEGKLTLRRGSPTGEVIFSADIEKGADRSYRTVSGEVSCSAGEEVVYLVFEGSVELNFFKFSNKKGVNEIIEAEDFDVSHGSVTAEPCGDGDSGENLGYVVEGDWVMYSRVDFGAGAEKLYMRLAGSGQSCNVRLDSPDGKKIASTGPVNTGGWTAYRTFGFDIEKVTGTHDVYITYDTGNSQINVNWFAFSDGSFVPEGLDKTEDSKEKRAGVRFGAEFFDGKRGSVKAEPCADSSGGQNLGYVVAGDWVKYTGFDFGGGVKKLSARLAGYGSTVEFRLDSADGELIASFAPSTGGWASYITVTAELSSLPSGTHDVYIVFRDSVNVNWFMFE